MQLGMGPRFFRKRRGPAIAPARLPVMQGVVFTGGSALQPDGSAIIPAGASWKGLHGSAMPRQNGLALLTRWQPGDVQDGAAGVANAPFAVGFFPTAAPADPLAAGHALTVANNGTFAGQMGVLGRAHGRAIRSVKQIEHDDIIICRDRGAVYYAAALAGSRGYGDRPNMRPLAVDGSRVDASLVPGVYTRASVSARVEEFQAAVLAEYPNWYLTAHAADDLIGSGALLGTPAQIGGVWAGTGSYVRTATGAQRTGASGANIDPGVVTGLLAAEFTFTTAVSGSEIQWNRTNGSNYCYVQLNATSIAFVQVVAGAATTIQTAPITSVANRKVEIQVQIEGQVVRCLVDGIIPSDIGPVTYPTAFNATRVGFYINDLNGPTRCTRFEAHPVAVPIPAVLRVEEPFAPKAGTVAFTEPFDGTGALGTPYTRSRGTFDAAQSAGSLSFSGSSTEDTHYVRPLATDYADLLLAFTTPPATSPDTTGARPTVVIEGLGPLLANETVAARAFIDPSQPGNTEIEIMGYLPGIVTAEDPNPPPRYLIIGRVAMALEIAKGAAQSIRFVVSEGVYIAYFLSEPVLTGRTPVATERVGIGAGTSDTGSRFNTLEVRT